MKRINVPMQDSMERYVALDNATPLFDWGRYYEKDQRILLPFSVQVHHSFVDGVHIGKLAQILQDYLNTI